VRGSVGKVRKGEFAEFMIFELPVVLQVFADIKSDRPIVIFPLDWLGERLSLRMALDAGVTGVDVIEARRIENIVADRLLTMRLTRTVTPFASDIPLRYTRCSSSPAAIAND